MPAKAKQQQYAPESESEEEETDMMGGDPTKYLNKNFSREFMATLPSKIRDRTKLLISFDDEQVKEQAAHDAKIVEIKKKFDQLYQPLYARRKEIVAGSSDATEEEITKGYPEEHKDKVDITLSEEATKEAVTGIPEFWLDALRHHVIIDQMITERDAEVLEHLVDITTNTLDNGFVVTFIFAPNEFMKETEVVKTIYTKKEFGQLAIDRTEETTITWNEGKDVTVETITQKQRSKKSNATREVTKVEPCDSFFNLFKHCENTEEAEQWCSVAATISDKIIPYAVEYVTGEAPDGSSDMEDGDDYYDEESEEEESDEEEMPRGKKGGPSGKAPAGAAGKDCKQQ